MIRGSLEANYALVLGEAEARLSEAVRIRGAVKARQKALREEENSESLSSALMIKSAAKSNHAKALGEAGDDLS
jgi:hypothetical protein